MKRRTSPPRGTASGRKPPVGPAQPRPPVPEATLAGQRRRLLAKHYINKYHVRRGR